jgi:pyroglutamyl-peptidase
LIVANLRRAGMPAHLSWNAGTYLCNAVLYRSLSLARARPNLKRNGFIHVPAALRAPGARRRPFGPVSPLTWQQAVDGSLCILATCLGRPSATAAARTAQR